ncbi:MAG: peroxide stress protein YaaA [Marinovum sp.]|nr:peroxide stress protein YaaA [Marinovum sp.]
MLVVVSPAKRLDWTEQNIEQTTPAMQADAVRLAKSARNLTLRDLKSLMDLSDDLARLNRDRFRAFQDEPNTDDTRSAMFAFAGDTYQGLDARSFSEADVARAQSHLRILSGLYGVLRPLDAIQPYRLEMGSRLKTRRGASLYAYWRDQIAVSLNADAVDLGTDTLVNCASQEYFGAVDRKALRLNVVTPQFLEVKGGVAKTISFFAKRARGAMARYIVQNALTAPSDLHAFDIDGYAFDAERSTPEAPVFLRDAAMAA